MPAATGAGVTADAGGGGWSRHGQPPQTLKEQVRRARSLLALGRAGGWVSGAQGTAVLLDINPETPAARM